MKNAVQDSLKISSHVVMLKPGLHIFRYASPSANGEKALLTLHSAPMGKGTVDFFPAEGVSRNTLSRLGDCMIVRVKGDHAGVLVSEYRLVDPGAAVASSIDLRIDYIDTSENFLKKVQQTAPVAVGPAPTPPAEDAILPGPAPAAWPTVVRESLELMGHIERVGDARATDGWLGNPSANARLEGFAIQWNNRPADVDLVYTCHVKGIGQMPAVFSGNYAGTRQKALPITALALTLAGPRAADFDLSGQVAFAGSPVQAIVPGQKLSGPQGSEPLVALRVQIARKGGETAVSRSPSASPWDDPRITQIFRANR